MQVEASKQTYRVGRRKKEAEFGPQARPSGCANQSGRLGTYYYMCSWDRAAGRSASYERLMKMMLTACSPLQKTIAAPTTTYLLLPL